MLRCLPPTLVLVQLLLCNLIHAQWEHGNSDDLFHFVTRPDLKPPKWNLTIHHPDLVSPGYWFVAPYHEPRDQEDPDDAWIGPHMYNGNGDLIWSGTSQFSNGKNAHGFELQNVRGEDVMTLLDRDQGTGVMLDDHFEIRDTITIDTPSHMNAHEFRFVDEGKRAVIINTWNEVSSIEDARTVGHDGGPCHGAYDGIREYDTKTWEVVWEWSPLGRIALTESTHDIDVGIEKRCNAEHGGWDFIHANSIDKTPEGDYLFSARHTDTIYKISGKDGSIIWRLGGFRSDFDMKGLNFSRQHHIRFRGQSRTRMMVSFLDNAKGRDSQEPTNECSRGILVALDEEKMTATVLEEYNHPDGGLANKQGSYQLLPNGNVFMGWSAKALQSEYTSNGTLVMEARSRAGWLVSYRNFKFPFIGHPLELPAVHSAAYGLSDGISARTRVHVSWNGATEVSYWNFYKTSREGGMKELVGSTSRIGFETMLDVRGYASYMVVEGVDESGEVLGSSHVVKTIPHPNVTAAAIEEERVWLMDAGHASDAEVDELDGTAAKEDDADGDAEGFIGSATKSMSDLAKKLLRSRVTAFLLGVLSCIVFALVLWLVKVERVADRLRRVRYGHLNDSEASTSGHYQDQDEDEADGDGTAESSGLLRSIEVEKDQERPGEDGNGRYDDG